MKTNTLTATSRLGIESYGFIIPRGSRITTREFATMIRDGYDNLQSREIAQSLDNIDGILSCDWSGTKYVPMNKENRIEIAVRNTGWQAVAVDDSPDTPYRIVALPTSGKPAGSELPGKFASRQLAYESAAKTLGMMFSDKEPALPDDPHVNAVFDAMRKIVEAPDAILKHYKNDFYKHDRDSLHAFAAQGKFLWCINKNGTHFGALGIHKRTVGMVEAGINSSSGIDRQIYLVDGDKVTVKQISRASALTAMKDIDYKVVGTQVRRGSTLIATMDVNLTSLSSGKAPAGIVSIEPIADVKMSLRDLIALREIALCEVIEKAGTLFIRADEVTVGKDKRDISEMIDIARGFTPDSDFTLYGTISADNETERGFIEALGVKLGNYDHKRKEFTAEVAGGAMAALEPFHGQFDWKLAALPHVIKPANCLCVVAVASLNKTEFEGYENYLRFAMDSNERNGNLNDAGTSYEADHLSDELEKVTAAKSAKKPRATKQSTLSSVEPV